MNANTLLTPLDIPEATVGDWSVVRKVEPPDKAFNTANLRCQMFGGQKNTEVSWPHETTWHYLKEGGSTWMSDLPCEHAQMRACVKGMRGRVLVGGLGLGLAAVLLCRMKAVKEVVVVELQKEVINLVAPYLKNTFNASSVQGDLFKYLKDCEPNAFDFALFDTWQSDGEGTFFYTVCPLLELSKGKVRHEPVAWNSGVMRGQLAHSIQSKMWFMRPEKPFGEYNGTPLWEHDGTDRPWHNWQVPWWQWWKERQPSDRLAQTAAGFYASIYGRWEWERQWEIFKEVRAS